jgi:hypothetical protein
MRDLMRCSAYFESVEDLKQALYAIRNGDHKDYIIDWKPKLTEDLRNVTIHMCVSDKTCKQGFLPFIGEVQLELEKPSRRKDVNHYLYEI